jgi:hypothetical protein
VDEWHKTGLLAEQRFHVPLEQVFGDVFGDDGFMLLRRVETPVAFLRSDFETDMAQWPESRIESVVFRSVPECGNKLFRRPAINGVLTVGFVPDRNDLDALFCDHDTRLRLGRFA